MNIWIIVSIALGLTAAAGIAAATAYFRQIRRINSQLEFMNGHSTSMRITEQMALPEMGRLIDGINAAVEKSRATEKETREREQELKDTIASLSHDIRTPLTSMDGYFQLLTEAETEEERLHYIAVIKLRLESLNAILEELFMYAKLQSESYEIPLEETDFGRCVFDTVFSFYDEFQKRGIKAGVNFCDDRLVTSGNSEALARALQNIIKNALEHGKDRISMTLKRENDGERSWGVFVCANTVEVPENIDASRVFDRFYKADSARSTSSTGLGLSIAKDLVEKTGGRISASLQDGVFSIEIRYELKLSR